MDLILERLLRNISKAMSGVFGNLFKNAQGDLLDFINPMALITNVATEITLYLLLILSFPILAYGLFRLSTRKNLKFSFLLSTPFK